MRFCLAFDLGTSGVKASLHDEAGKMLCSSHSSYTTQYSRNNLHEQRPLDWWSGVCRTSKAIVSEANDLGISAADIVSVSVSGHSMVSVPISSSGLILQQYVPIWSDRRATKQTHDFFNTIEYHEWYRRTGNGDPAECYSIFKLMWLKERQREVYDNTHSILGSKDFINYKLTGEFFATDYSYASGSGVFDLEKNNYIEEYIEAADIRFELFPQPVESHTIVGEICQEAASITGLQAGTPVVCGGVDNACMALGACGLGENRTYIALGTSCWIATTSRKPIINSRFRPYVYSHVKKGWYSSAASLLSGCSVLDWAKNIMYDNVESIADSYRNIETKVSSVDIGCNGLFFLPTLAGGGNHQYQHNLKGALMGLSLETKKEEIYRAIYEGIAIELFNLWSQFPVENKESTTISICGGGSNSNVWCEIIADVFDMPMFKCLQAQHITSFGAATVALRGVNIWSDYSKLDEFLYTGEYIQPDQLRVQRYEGVRQGYGVFSESICDYFDKLGSGLQRPEI